MLWLQRRHPCGSHSSANSFSAIGLKLQIFMSRSRERENKESQGHEMNRRFQRLPSLPSSSVGICYIWCTDSPPFSLPHPPVLTPPHPPPPTHSLCIHVVLCSATACGLISTNKFILDTNYSSATSSSAVGWSNERQQSPHHRGPPFFSPSVLVGHVSDRTTMDLRILPRFFSPSSAPG